MEVNAMKELIKKRTIMLYESINGETQEALKEKLMKSNGILISKIIHR